MIIVPGPSARRDLGQPSTFCLGTIPPAAALAGLTTADTPAPSGTDLGSRPISTAVNELLSLGSAAALIPVVPGAGAYVGDGMPPVPAKLVLKIRRWEFMEMGVLLPEFRVGHKEVEVESVKERRGRQARKVMDIFSWLQCYATYVAVLAPYEPSAIPELMAYMGIIIRVSQDYEGLRWVRYDSAFRRQAALSGNRKMVGH